MLDKQHPIRFVGKMYKRIEKFMEGLEPMPPIPQNIHEVAQLQKYANEQLAQGAELDDIGSGGATGILEKGKQGVTYGFNNCYLTAGISLDGKAFLAHEDSPYLNTASAFNSFGKIQLIWLNKELTSDRYPELSTGCTDSNFFDHTDKGNISLKEKNDLEKLQIIKDALSNFILENDLILDQQEINWLIDMCREYITRDKLEIFLVKFLYTSLIRKLEYLSYEEETEYIDKLQNSVFFRYSSNKINQKIYAEFSKVNLSEILAQLAPGSTLFIGESYSYSYSCSPIDPSYIYNLFRKKISDQEIDKRLNRVFEIVKKSPNMLYTNIFQQEINLAINRVFQDLLINNEKEIKDIQDYIKRSFYEGDDNIIRTDEYIRTVYEKTKLAVESGKVSKVLIYPPKIKWNFDEPKKADGSIDEADLYTNPTRGTRESKGRAWRLAPGPDGRYRLFAERCFLHGGGKYKTNISGGTNAPIYLEPREIDLSQPITVESITQQLLKFGFIKNSFVPSTKTTGPKIY
jgi:hypothetical protein